MPKYSKATQRILSKPTGPITPTAVIVHSNAGTSGDLYGWWTNPGSGSLSSHFQVTIDGHVYQYVDTSNKAVANVSANSYAISIETANNVGFGTFPKFNQDVWRGAQLAALEDLIEWCCATHGIRRAHCTDGRNGIGAHDEYSFWTTPGHVCPGTARKAQLKNEIIPRLGKPTPPPTPPEDEMNPAQEKKLDAAVSTSQNALAEAKAANLRAAANQGMLTKLSVSDAYRRILKREPSQDEITFWVGRAEIKGIDKVIEEIADSDEAKRANPK